MNTIRLGMMVAAMAVVAPACFAGSYYYSPSGKYVSQNMGVTNGDVETFSSAHRTSWNAFLNALRKREAAEAGRAPCGVYNRVPRSCRFWTTAYDPFLDGFNK